MSTLKRAHRRLEGRLYSTEKMLASAAIQQLMPYPRAELASALEALLFSEFHDILPGSSVAEVEAQALHRLGYGFDIVDRLRARAFFALLRGQPAAAEGEYPLFVHNPHPFPVSATVVCEFQPPEPNTDAATLLVPDLADSRGAAVPLQVEKESCNIQADQRKRIVFHASLAPSCTSRYACRLRAVPRPAAESPRPVSGVYRHRTDGCEIDIDASSGLLVGFRVERVAIHRRRRISRAGDAGLGRSLGHEGPGLQGSPRRLRADVAPGHGGAGRRAGAGTPSGQDHRRRADQDDGRSRLRARPFDPPPALRAAEARRRSRDRSPGALGGDRRDAQARDPDRHAGHARARPGRLRCRAPCPRRRGTGRPPVGRVRVEGRRARAEHRDRRHLGVRLRRRRAQALLSPFSSLRRPPG